MGSTGGSGGVTVVMNINGAAGMASTARFLLWIDGVGGLLVSTGDRVLLGQAVPGNPVDVPILADIARRHVRIHREDRYLLEPLSDVWIRQRPVQSMSVLSDGDTFRLGSGLEMRFRQPHALSATARLEWVSHHRTRPQVDAVLLMADTCVLGPQLHSHVICRDWSQEVVLYRQGGDWMCRCRDGLEVDGRFSSGSQAVTWDSHVRGSDFSFSLERIEAAVGETLGRADAQARRATRPVATFEQGGGDHAT